AALFWESHELWVFAAIGIGLIVTFGITFLTIQEPPPVAEPRKLAGMTPAKYVRDVLQHRELAKYAGTQFFFWLGVGAAGPFLTRFAVNVLEVDESVAFQ